MIWVLLVALLMLNVNAVEFGSDELLKSVNQKISQELMMTGPFWTNTMIPVAICLAVILLIVSIFTVSLIAIKALNEPEPEFISFAPPGFDALWERNVQAELGMNLSNVNTNEGTTTVADIVKIDAQVPETRNFIKKEPMRPKKPVLLNMPIEPPIPKLASNSKTGLDVIHD